RGHRVTLAVNEGYREIAQELGFDFASLVSDKEVNGFLQNPDVWHPVKSALLGARWGVSRLAEQYELLRDLSSSDESIIAASPAIISARLVQEKLKRPLVSIYHIPWMIISSTAPPAMTSGFTLPAGAPRPVGQLYWWMMDKVASILLGGRLNGFRRTLQLKPLRRPFQWWASPDLALGLFPDWYAVPQADWLPQMKVAGFPVFDGLAEAQTDSDVEEFCASSDPPVAFTFGTGMLHAGQLFQEAVDACVRMKRPAILLSRDARQIPRNLPPHIRHYSYVPLEQLLSSCAAIVHHGGIGTVARSLAAGTPQLIIPHAWDQLDNAQRVIRLGAGAMLKRRHFTATRLSEQLGRLLTDDFSVPCREISEKFSDSNNPGLATGWIEEYAAQQT
ncbi:MAG: hypothetical protein GY758_23845, partial [Fuerstiella sp.]|nr:hypothetical protein [Fuerstiella sp.]